MFQLSSQKHWERRIRVKTAIGVVKTAVWKSHWPLRCIINEFANTLDRE